MNKKIRYTGGTYDEERAFYGSVGIAVDHCRFDGPADGESAFKECSDLAVDECFFNLRYPFWHDHGLTVERCELTELCRAAFWYSDRIGITDSVLHGVKALRECADVTIRRCDIVSTEFGWSVRGITMEDCTAKSEYFMMRSEDLRFKNVTFGGKYSFQYIKNAVFEDCVFDTKDAFWHAENVLVKNCVVRGEYLAWYSDGLTLDHCRISGTQPLCYCKNLTLIDCEMLDADLCFEKSEVNATVTTPLVSIKNPLAGKIVVPSVGEIIRDDPRSEGKILVTNRTEV